uniref:Uncharacterized protein n=1 Tax=Plectus sambesii TaxID=2011161 RepID=A0A914WPB8_9BILA
MYPMGQPYDMNNMNGGAAAFYGIGHGLLDDGLFANTPAFLTQNLMPPQHFQQRPPSFVVEAFSANGSSTQQSSVGGWSQPALISNGLNNNPLNSISQALSSVSQN